MVWLMVDELEDIFGIRDDTIGVECSQISQKVLYCAANSITTALPMASFSVEPVDGNLVLLC